MGNRTSSFAKPQGFTSRACPRCKKYVAFNPLQVRHIQQEFTPPGEPTRIDNVSYITCPNCQYKYFEVGRVTIKNK